jgi:polysaccharide biosynthesis protein PslA
LLALLDSICILASFVIAALLRDRLHFHNEWGVIVAVLIPVYLAAATNGHAYSVRNLKEPRHAIWQGFRALLLAIVAVVFIAFAFKASDQFPRTVVAIGAVLSIFSVAAARYFFVRHTDWIIGKALFHTIVIREGHHILPQGHFTLMESDNIAFDPETHDPMLYDQFAKSLESADRLVVLCDPHRRSAWAQALKGINIQSELVVPELDELAPLGVGLHDNVSTLVVAKGPLGLFDRFVKRTFDLTIALFAIVALSPLLAIIAIIVKLDSAGPVLFRQTRIGRANQMFEIWKFRSMATSVSDFNGNTLTARNDVRVTRIGRFIRKTSIDELPQLFQVLKGDMSIVGPRPHALGAKAADKLYWEVDERYWARHAAKPGLTGLAQIRGFRGNTVVEDDLIKRLHADLEYLDSWSIWKDLYIVYKTLNVLVHKNAF